MVRQGRLSDLLRDCLDQRDKRVQWTAAHAFAASAESFGVEVMKSFFQILKSRGQQDQLMMKDKDGDTPLQSAIRSRVSKEIIEQFIADAKELDLNQTRFTDMLRSHNNKNQSPLLSAFDHSHWVAVDVLLKECISTE